MKSFLKDLKTRIWFIVTCILLVILIAADIVLGAVIPGVMNTLFGGDRSVVKAGAGSTEYYKADEGITDKASAKAAGDALNERICEEGIVLLKNEGNTLPLNTSSKALNVSVFGQNSVNLAYGSTGSVGGSVEDAPTIFDSLKAAGFNCNPKLKSLYENSGNKRPEKGLSGNDSAIVVGFPTAELAVNKYGNTSELFSGYQDAALVVITRTSGEQNDMPLTMKNSNGTPVAGAASADDHYLELDQNEQDMLKLACENFDKVILVLNSSVPMELGFLDGNNAGDATMNSYDYASHVQAALWIGMPGESGIMALGRVLNGEVNPSGRTADTYARDFMSIPSVQNFSCNGNTSSGVYTSGGSNVSGGYFVDYEEGIYVGYKYFETRGETDGKEWYKNNVVYPFGYGLSYSKFDWEITNAEQLGDLKLDKNSTVTVEVDVTNKQDSLFAGKDVVELYVTLPYYEGGIEKSSKVLVDFAKTEEIPVGETRRVTLSFDTYDLASFDYNDANKNGFKGYEVEAGAYSLCVSKNSHEVVSEIEAEVEKGITYATDPVTGKKVESIFDDIDDELQTTLSRADWEGTFPQMRTSAEISSATLNAIKSKDSKSPINAQSEVVVENAKNRPAAKGIKDGEIKLYDFIGLEDDKCDWDGLIKQLTFSQMFDVISTAAFKTNAIPEIGKLDTSESDGPAGFVNFMDKTNKFDGCCFYCSECVLASAWSKELAHEMGNAIGNEALFGYKSEGRQRTYSGWYAPGVNIHRTPFGGRNPEYYSEDAVFSGLIASEVIQGAAEKGVYCYLKHFAANEQETHRNGVCTWLTEQTYREIYLKAFEIATKESDSLAIMSSFNRVGTTWTGGDYRLLTTVLRDEWGFKGTVICDFATGQPHMDITQMLYAGGDLWLDTLVPSNNMSKNNAADVYVVQEATRHILYTQLHSNAMNGLGTGSSIVVKLAYWKITLIAANVIIFVGLAAWGTAVIILSKRKKENK